MKSKTLLEKLLDAKAQQKALVGCISQEMLEEYEVAIAWAEGKIESGEAASVLGISQSGAMAQKAGTALRNLISSGYISLTWKERVDIRAAVSE
jgi:hypothetical protein